MSTIDNYPDQETLTSRKDYISFFDDANVSSHADSIRDSLRPIHADTIRDSLSNLIEHKTRSEPVYNLSREKQIGGGDKAMNICIYTVEGRRIKDEHFGDATEKYKSTFQRNIPKDQRNFKMLPDPDDWIVITDDRDKWIATVALNKASDNDMPFVFSGVPEGGMDKMLQATSKKHFNKLTSDNVTAQKTGEVGSLAMDIERLLDKKAEPPDQNIKSVARELFLETANNLLNKGFDYISVIVTKDVRSLFRSLGMNFYPFLESSDVFGNESLDEEGIRRRMRASTTEGGMNMPNDQIDAWSTHYREWNVPEQKKKVKAQSGILDLKQVREALGVSQSKE